MNPKTPVSIANPFGISERRRVGYGFLGLAALVVLVYSQVFQFGFLTFDDDVHVYQNPTVQHGLAAEGIRGAFTQVIQCQWIPLTWIAHMLMVTLFGLDPSWHHLVGLVLHAANSCLLFAVLRRLTGEYWPSLMVAGLFAVHPVGVESVAWISELKNLLSSFFWLLAIWFYSFHARERAAACWMTLVALCMGLGLLSKQMLVTLPFALLLLDFWPLNRKLSWPSLLKEKWPLFLLSAAASAVTISIGMSSQNLVGERVLPLSWRIGNVLTGYSGYLKDLFWPNNLCALYLIQPRFPAAAIAVSIALLLGLTGGFWLRKRSAPFLLVGWLWFLGVLFPVSGILQNGVQSRADRYLYLPQIGLYFALVWMLRGLPRRAAQVLGGAVIGALSLLTFWQTSTWADMAALGEQAVRVNPDNMVAHVMAGSGRQLRGEYPMAIAHYREAVRLRPNNSKYRFYLGTAMAWAQDYGNASKELAKAVEIDPTNTMARRKLMEVLALQGRLKEAEALIVKPGL